MARTRRIKVPGAAVHGTSHGSLREAILVDDGGSWCLLELLAQTMGMFDATVHAGDDR